MDSRATEFQVRGKALVDAAAARRGVRLNWTQQEGNLYPGELMIVGSTTDRSLTVWLYDDSVDTQIKGRELLNFAAESYPSGDALLQDALAHLEELMGKLNVRA